MRILKVSKLVIVVTSLLCFSGCMSKQTHFEFNAVKEMFNDVDSLCKLDDGKLWGVNLYGPILLVSSNDRSVIANMPDNEGFLREKDGLYFGQLPDAINIANTATTWGGVEWAMINWASLQNKVSYKNSNLIIHESWHREQEEIGVKSVMSTNVHLDEEFGIILMKLELVALKNTLEFKKGFNSDLNNALFIRKYRQLSFPENNEDDFERHEGMAEYTGLKLCGIDTSKVYGELVKYVNSALAKDGYRNSFAYFTGPAYGFIFDRLYPNWLQQIKEGRSITEIALQHNDVDFQEDDSVKLQAKLLSIVENYNAASMVNDVKEKSKKNKELAEYYEQKLFGNNQLIIQNQNTSFTFNPNEKLILVRDGVVYKTFRLTDDWGTLEVSEGIYRANNGSVYVTSAPKQLFSEHDKPIEWDGYKLILNKGYSIVEVEEGKFSINKR